MEITDSTFIILLFSVSNTKMKRDWDISFFNYIKIKQIVWFSYSFKATFDYSAIFSTMYFRWYDTTLKKMLF